MFYRIALVKGNYRKISFREGCSCVTGVLYVRHSVMSSGEREGAHITKTTVAREGMLPFFRNIGIGALCTMYIYTMPVRLF